MKSCTKDSLNYINVKTNERKGKMAFYFIELYENSMKFNLKKNTLCSYLIITEVIIIKRF